MSSPPLADLQRWLSWAFTEPRGIVAALADPGPAEPRPRLLAAVADAPPVSLARRLAVYADAYFLRLRDTLAADFPAVSRFLGAERFRRLAADYLTVHPSTSTHIEDLGDDLPRFLAGHPFSREHPFLPDLAQLEWSVLESLYADRFPPLRPDALQRIPPEAWARARLGLDPTVRLLALGWPVDRLWERRFKGRLPRVLKPGPRRLLVYRDDDWVQARALDQEAFLTLTRIQEGKTLGDICAELETAAQGGGDLPLAQWLGDWVRDGVLKRVDAPAR